MSFVLIKLSIFIEEKLKHIEPAKADWIHLLHHYRPPLLHESDVDWDGDLGGGSNLAMMMRGTEIIAQGWYHALDRNFDEVVGGVENEW